MLKNEKKWTKIKKMTKHYKMRQNIGLKFIKPVHLPIIPLTVDAALMQACVPRAPACRAAKTKATFSATTLAESPKSLLANWSLGLAWQAPAFLTKSMQAVPNSCTALRIR